jgi:Ulp1 family protease
VDYDILQSFGPNSWLTDASLTYSLSLIASNHVETPLETTESDLERVLGRRRALPKAVLLLDPASAFWLTLSAESPGDLERTRKSLQLEDRELILCPVNDCQMGCEGDAGTHWSLLVCMVSSGREGSQFHFVHYDSMRCASGRKSTSFLNAEALAGRLSGRPVVVEQASCAQQINGFDCGMYVLSFVSIILGVYMKTSGVQPEDWADRVAQISPQTVASLRKRFYEKVKASLD